ncbi:MAG: hypothetical protein HQ500_05685 [Flavobacteriales bacterium]|nr:hypothetical protein [Flavobacteriales bacterium]
MDEVNQLEHVITVNNPESVVEIYLDKQAKQVVEIKGLTDNRYKTYRYQVAEYLDRVIGYKGVDIKLKAHLGR